MDEKQQQALRESYLAAREAGLTKSEACREVGISIYRASKWRQNPKWAAREDQSIEAGMDMIRAHVRQIMLEQQHADPGVSLRAADVLLRYESAGKPTRVEMSGPGGSPIRLQRADDLAVAEATTQWLEQIRAALPAGQPEHAQPAGQSDQQR
jgi:hypothetical protein